MFKYIVRRLLIAIPVLLGVTCVAYFIMTLAPGDAVDMLIDPGLSAQDLVLQREVLGLNEPVPVRYVKWLTQLAQGNLGFSFNNRQPVTTRIAERIVPTLALAFFALLWAYALGIPIGVLAAVRQYSIFDYIATVTSYLGVSLPSFFFGLLLIFVFSLKLNLLPTGGMQTIGAPSNLLDQLAHVILPSLVLGLYNAAVVMRYTRSSMLEAIHQDYVRTAHGKGLREQAVIFGHALRNALMPVITLAGLQFPFLLGGAIITEQVFNWPGMGRLAVEAIFQRDYPVIMGLNLLTAVMVTLGNLVADVSYGLADPRIRYGGD
ncbi:MAG: ABC transporter permease [Chloroflexota bacterium]